MNVLVVAPHPDDESIGCGGAIATHADAGDRVTVVWLTSGGAGVGSTDPARAREIRETEAVAAAGLLGLTGHIFLGLPDGDLGSEVTAATTAIAGLVDRIRPGVVYAPHELENHPDHVAAFHATEVAMTAAPSGGVLHCYEVWTPLTWFDVVLPIDGQMGRKLEAVGCYRSQLEHFRLEAAAAGLAAYRGALAGGCDYAEVFSCPAIDG